MEYLFKGSICFSRGVRVTIFLRDITDGCWEPVCRVPGEGGYWPYHKLVDSAFDRWVTKGRFKRIKDSSLLSVLRTVRSERQEGIDPHSRTYRFLPRGYSMDQLDQPVFILTDDKSDLSGSIRV